MQRKASPALAGVGKGSLTMMRDLFFIGFLGLCGFMGLRRPYIFIMLFCYVDIVMPQKVGYSLLSLVPLSLIMFGLAIGSWLLFDSKKGTRIDALQIVLGLLLFYCAMTTIFADFPEPALEKWAWVWKALLWAIFLPLTLRTKLRIETLVLVLVLSAGALAISGGMKTAFGGGGYGTLRILVQDNSGLFEGSIFSTVAIAIIPLILWLAKHGTIFKPSRYVWAFAICLTGACLLIPIGTQARTGLMCAALLVLLGLRDSKRRMAYIGTIAALGVVALPLVPAAFSSRMSTISNYQGDESASTRLAIWAWTWNYALDHPMGGGFMMFLQNEIQVDRVETQVSGGQVIKTVHPYTDRARAFHNSYFEMLGEQGFPGLALWLLLQITCVIRMEAIRRRYKAPAPGDAWISPLATALQSGHLVYMMGAMFVGIAFQPFIYMMIGLQIGLHTYLKRREEEAHWRPISGDIASRGFGTPATATAPFGASSPSTPETRNSGGWGVR